jgi:hypothetical protein
MTMTSQESMPGTSSSDSHVSCMQETHHPDSLPGFSPFDRVMNRLKGLFPVHWNAPHRWENLATRCGVAAVLTMSAIQTAYFFGLASPDPVEKAKAIVFSGWMDFCLFMAFIRAQRASAQEDYGRAVLWFIGCLPLAAFTFLCNFMFSSHWQPPDPLALERVGLSPLVALWIYACVPLVAVVYGTLFTVKEVTREERQARARVKAEAAWQAEIDDPRGRLRAMRRQRRVLAEMLHMDLDDLEPQEQALLAQYEDLLLERGISLAEREAPLQFEALLMEIRRLGIQPGSPDAVVLFQLRSRGPSSAVSTPPQAEKASRQISPPAKAKNTPLASKGHDADNRSVITTSAKPDSLPKQPGSDVSEASSTGGHLFQAMLAGGSGAWPSHLTTEEFIQHTRYNPDYVKRLVRRGEIKTEEVEGERRIPIAELARFALERMSEEMAAQLIAGMTRAKQEQRIVEADQDTPAADVAWQVE